MRRNLDAGRKSDCGDAQARRACARITEYDADQRADNRTENSICEKYFGQLFF
jgi:hypothetical protein